MDTRHIRGILRLLPLDVLPLWHPCSTGHNVNRCHLSCHKGKGPVLGRPSRCCKSGGITWLTDVCREKEVKQICKFEFFFFCIWDITISWMPFLGLVNLFQGLSKSISSLPSLPPLLAISSSSSPSPAIFFGMTSPFNHVARVCTSQISPANLP